MGIYGGLRRTDLRGSWLSLLEITIPDDIELVQSIHLKDRLKDKYYSCLIFYDDLEPIEYPDNRWSTIETAGTIKEAIEKASLYGTVIEINRCGINLYCAIYS